MAQDTWYEQQRLRAATGGGVVVWREDAGWQVEGVYKYGPNVVGFLLTSGGCSWYVLESYVTPNDVSAVHWVEQVLVVKPKGVDTIFLGDLNARLGGTHGELEE